MYALDSDIVSLYLRHQGQQPHLERRIKSAPPQDLWISIVTVEENIAGAFRLINGSRKDPQHIQKQWFGYRLLSELISDFAHFQILPFDAAANELYQNMSAEAKRHGANDCKIAASALSRGFTVITRNIKHFQAIGAPCLDWTLEEIGD